MQSFVRHTFILLSLVVGIGITLSQGCSSESTPDTAATKDASGNGSDTFVVGANGTTRTLTLPNGQALTFVFPASAAGETITLGLVDDADYGLEGEHPNLIEMLPHGLQFDPPVLVTPDWSGPVPVLRTFADAAGAANPEILPIASDLKAFELAHFSLLSLNGIDYNCPFAGTDVPGISKLCKSTQEEVVFYCDNTSQCRAIRAHCCQDIVNNSKFVCTELLDYTTTPINYPPCGPGDAGADAVVDGSVDGAAGAAGSGGSGGTGTGGSGGSGGGTVGGCPNTGYYDVAASGSCGDLNTQAPLQRLDGNGCSLYWEFDGGPSSLGIGSASLNYSPSGVTSGLPINLGSGVYTCTATSAHPNLTLACTGPGACNLTLFWTASL